MKKIIILILVAIAFASASKSISACSIVADRMIDNLQNCKFDTVKSKHKEGQKYQAVFSCKNGEVVVTRNILEVVIILKSAHEHESLAIMSYMGDDFCMYELRDSYDVSMDSKNYYRYKDTAQNVYESFKAKKLK